MDFEQITDKEKKALHIADVSESDLLIKGRSLRIDFTRYPDGDVEMEVNEYGNSSYYIFDKKQLDFLAKWLTHSR